MDQQQFLSSQQQYFAATRANIMPLTPQATSRNVPNVPTSQNPASQSQQGTFRYHPTFNGVVSPPVPVMSQMIPSWLPPGNAQGGNQNYGTPFIYPNNMRLPPFQNTAQMHYSAQLAQLQNSTNGIPQLQTPITQLTPALLHLQTVQQFQMQQQYAAEASYNKSVSPNHTIPFSAPTKRRGRPPRRESRPAAASDGSEDFELPSSRSSGSDSKGDDDDSDFASGRIRGRGRRRGRPRGRPPLRGRTAGRAPDSPEDLWPAVGSRVSTRGKRWVGRRKRKGSDDSEGFGSAGGDSQGSDSSFCSGTTRGGKRRRGTRSTTLTESPSYVSRSSARPTKSQRVNYAQLGMVEGLEDEEEENNESLLTDIVTTATIGLDKILGYRLKESHEGEDYSVTPLTKPDGSAPLIDEVEFLVKWVGKSHLHNTVEGLVDLRDRSVAGIRKVENFIHRMETLRKDRVNMTEDEIEQQDIGLEMQKQLDQDCLIAERLISHRVDVVKDDELVQSSTEEIVIESPNLSSSSSIKKLDMYFVKWNNSSYDQCTWETEETITKYGFKALISQFWDREDRVVGQLSAKHPLHVHALSRTSFEPYQETPWFIKDSNDPEFKLRDYQLTGVNWMISRMKKGLSVLLADEMGLGKTVQTISVIGHIMYAELVVGPFLVVVPQSTADNWLSEFRRWLGHANVIVYHGNPTARDFIRSHEMSRVRAAPFVESQDSAVGSRVPPSGRRQRLRCDVCICTPSILNNIDDLEFLRSIDWYLMAIDEAHLLKNRESRRFKELNAFSTRYRLLLSGTPLHNNLEEMWSLLHFLSPRIYEDLNEFKQRFSEIERTDSVGELKEKQLEKLQRELHELVLRRVKRDVEKSLPKKIERILRVELSPKQLQCCEAIVARNYEVLAKTAGGSKASLQNICMELKKACNHPLLLQTDNDIYDLRTAASLSATARQEWQQNLLHNSGKLALLDKLLPYLRDKGHRVLIFSQMVRMLNILSRYLTLRGFKHQRLDGTMGREVRKKSMDHFNAPDSDDFCFLLSTKAGGLGINLTSADTVIIYDSDWNPQNDLQAEARAHRIGQTKTVQIYRLVTKDTVEERILERAKAKMVLDTLVIQGLNKRDIAGNATNISSNGVTPIMNTGGGKDSFGFSRDELTRILKFGAARLWKSQTADGTTTTATEPDGTVTVDLDKVLAEAEERDSDATQGLADDLLSSFTNISDFRYEAPPDPLQYDDKDFWDKTIPLEQRLAREAKNENLVGRKRQRKQVEQSKLSTRYAEMLDYEDQAAAETAVKKKKNGKNEKTKIIGLKKKKKSSDIQSNERSNRSLMADAADEDWNHPSDDGSDNFSPGEYRNYDAHTKKKKKEKKKPKKNVKIIKTEDSEERHKRRQSSSTSSPKKIKKNKKLPSSIEPSSPPIICSPINSPPPTNGEVQSPSNILSNCMTPVISDIVPNDLNIVPNDLEMKIPKLSSDRIPKRTNRKLPPEQPKVNDNKNNNNNSFDDESDYPTPISDDEREDFSDVETPIIISESNKTAFWDSPNFSTDAPECVNVATIDDSSNSTPEVLLNSDLNLSNDFGTKVVVCEPTLQTPALDYFNRQLKSGLSS